MRRLLLSVALAACGGDPFTLVHEEQPIESEDAGAETSPPHDARFLPREDAGAPDSAPLDSAATDSAPICDPGFPDGGWYCGPSWVNAPNTFLCVERGGVYTTLNPIGVACSDGCGSCATCDAAKACRFFDAGAAGCDDVNGRLVVRCR